MNDYYVVRQPQMPIGGMGGGLFGPFQGLQFMFPGRPPQFGPGFPPGQGPGPGFPSGQGPGPGFPPGQGPGPGFPPGQGPGPGFPPGQGPGPGFPPGQGPGPGFPPGPGGGPRPPAGRPPAFIPSYATAQHMGFGVYAVEPFSIRPCLYRYTYIWLDNGQQFWAWPVFVGRNSLSGWRWIGFTWVYFGVDLDRIDSFVCY